MKDKCLTCGLSKLDNPNLFHKGSLFCKECKRISRLKKSKSDTAKVELLTAKVSELEKKIDKLIEDADNA